MVTILQMKTPCKVWSMLNYCIVVLFYRFPPTMLRVEICSVICKYCDEDDTEMTKCCTLNPCGPTPACDHNDDVGISCSEHIAVIVNCIISCSSCSQLYWWRWRWRWSSCSDHCWCYNWSGTCDCCYHCSAMYLLSD